ncbi:Gfo/Idh/MocA family oxidoreductase [uncultured Pseudokineococcus sp.]|uniref:Gfo/Idh/MocA family protein n=1 Tax=uncultured Pseudokineococcus sp. TaxID=1642928 RepID=UPI00261BC45C|nr:Gfo/Idh/MocA family oxidoreductase [uncultured Pseudokineococcus sp.]
MTPAPEPTTSGPLSTAGAPLRLGVLGAARITEEALTEPARRTGHRLVAVAARDRARAQGLADRAGVERVHGSYAELLADDDVEVVYDPLPNALHGTWNLAAVRAGRHVLTEKPSTACAADARAVRDAAAAAGVHVVEAFHHLHHPVHRRLVELLASGELGELRRVEVDMLVPAPGDDDPRWSLELGGGALMDLGCYGLRTLRELAPLVGGEPVVTGARAVEHPDHPGVDAELVADLALPSGATAVVRSRMGGDDVVFSCRLVGSRGEATAPCFVKPQWDDRVVVRVGDDERTEHLGTRSSYDHQLDALTRLLRQGPSAQGPSPQDPDLGADDAVATMELVDACYAAAGLGARPAVL